MNFNSPLVGIVNEGAKHNMSPFTPGQVVTIPGLKSNGSFFRVEGKSIAIPADHVDFDPDHPEVAAALASASPSDIELAKEAQARSRELAGLLLNSKRRRTNVVKVTNLTASKKTERTTRES